MGPFPPDAIAEFDDTPFHVRITGTTTWLGTVAAYTAVEWSLKGDGTWGDKGGGRALGAGNPGIPIDGVTFTPDTTSGSNPPLASLAVAKASQTAGGLVFELHPFGSGGGNGANAILAAKDPDTGFWSWYPQVISGTTTINGPLQVANAVPVRQYSATDAGDPKVGDAVVMFSSTGSGSGGSGGSGSGATYQFIAHPTASGGGSGAGCLGCSWLLNPDTGACLKLQVLSGKGMCACIDTTQAFPLTYFSTSWKGGMLNTCCGCSVVEFKVTTGSGSTPSATLTLLADNDSCATGAEYTYDLVFLGCCADGTAIFAGTGPDNCSGNPAGYCDNTFVVGVSCGDPVGTVKCDCAACCGVPSSPIVEVVIPDGWTGYSGDYVIVYQGSCVWSSTCKTGSGSGATSKTITVTNNGNTTAPFWDLNVGGALYRSTDWDCYSGNATWSYVSGGSGSPPATITTTGYKCGLNPDHRCTNSDTLTGTITAATGDCTCLVGYTFSMTKDLFDAPYDTWNGGFTGCPLATCSEILVLKCNHNGTYSLQVGRATGSGFAGSTTVSTSVQADPLFVVFKGVPFGACCTGTVDVVFAA